MAKRTTWILAGLISVAILAVAGAFIAFRGTPPVRVLTHYPWDALAAEARTMSECAECHAGETFHGCDTCHDDHGAVEMVNVPFYAGVTLEGDVPVPGYVLLNNILPYRDQPHTHTPLLAMLDGQGAGDFESVTLASLDGGFVTMTRENLTEQALLMPYIDGIRFAAEDLHISSWLKGIRRIIVVSAPTPLLIEGQATSIGRLLLGPTLELTVEQTTVMLNSPEDGVTRAAQAGARIQGIPLSALVANPGFTELVVRDGAGQETRLSPEETRGAVLAQFRGQTTLILPERGRAQWVTGVVELESR
jgi:hypothetical protein